MTLEEVKGKYAEDLIIILNTDHRLIETLKSSRAPRSVVEFEEYYRTLSERNSASVFSIVQDGRAIGLGMIANRDFVVNSARMNFWIGTNFLSERNVDDAFTLLVDEAMKLELDVVSAVMTDQDKWLIRVWEKYGAERRNNAYDGHVSMMLKLR